MFGHDTEAGDTNEQPAAKRSKGEDKLMHFKKDISETNNTEIPAAIEDQFNLELIRYEGEQPISSSPIDWWVENQSRYPLLSQLARRYLSIPATSVPCERVFSTAGYVVSEKGPACFKKM